MNTLGRTWLLFKQSFNVLSEEPSLVVFPILTAVSAILLVASFFVPLYRIGTFTAIAHRHATWVDYVPLVSWYYANTFVVVFFNSALTACVNIRLSGGNPTLADGLRIAASRLPRIAAWTLVSASVGLLLRAIESSSDRWGRIFTSILGAGWTLITYLISPVVIIEDRTVGASVKRSTQLLRRTWGEQLAGNFGFGLLTVFLCLPGIIIGLAACRLDAAAGVILIVMYLLILAAVASAVKGIFTVALYRYASEGRAPFGFSPEALAGFTQRTTPRPSW